MTKAVTPAFRLTAKTLSGALEQLKQIRQKNPLLDRGSLPQISVLLQGGAKFTGWVIDVELEEGVSSVVLQVPTATAEVNLTYIAVPSIAAITVHLGEPPPKEEPKPKEKEVAAASTVPALSKQEINRKIAALQVAVNSAVDSTISFVVSWTTITDRPEAATALVELMTQFTSALKELVSNPKAKENLRTKITTIRFEHTARANMDFDGGTLTISAPLNDGKVGFADVEELKNAIRSHL